MGKRRQCTLCDRTTKTHRVSVEGICSTCEQAFHYWRKKTPSQIVKRARQIVTIQARMDIMMGNVKSHTRRRKAA